jgi:hypothetical protein
VDSAVPVDPDELSVPEEPVEPVEPVEIVAPLELDEVPEVSVPASESWPLGELGPHAASVEPTTAAASTPTAKRLWGAVVDTIFIRERLESGAKVGV